MTGMTASFRVTGSAVGAGVAAGAQALNNMPSSANRIKKRFILDISPFW
jgi:hypothetical protein